MDEIKNAVLKQILPLVELIEDGVCDQLEGKEHLVAALESGMEVLFYQNNESLLIRAMKAKNQLLGNESCCPELSAQLDLAFLIFQGWGAKDLKKIPEKSKLKNVF